MSNWDLMMPGMGLTAIGLAGLVLSYAEIAETFIDGMHALTGLTMFVGLIFLAAGILDGGISTSNRAKATTLVILSIALGFGTFAMTLNSSDFTIVIAGILMAIAFPSIVIAYLAMKHPTIVKPIGSIVGMASATGIIMWVAFGFVSPDTYILPQEVEIIEEPVEEEVTSTAPVYSIEILADSSTVGNPDYLPDVAVVPHGNVIEWTNADTEIHTVTSTVGFGELFDSSLMIAGDVWRLDTAELEAGEHEYLCSVHVNMVATIIIEAPTEPTVVTIPEGAGFPKNGQLYYDPENITVEVGTTVAWDNVDNVLHTVTSGTVENQGDGIFDSGLQLAGEIFEHTFNDVGTFDYYCIVHPWMIGQVIVE